MKIPLKVLMIAKFINYTIHGGLSRHTFELCKALKKQGCQVFMACMSKPENTVMNIENKILVPCFPLSFVDLISFNLNMLKKIRGYDIDILHSQLTDGFIFSIVKKTPFVVTVHASGVKAIQNIPKLRYHIVPYATVLLEKCIYKKADKIIVVSMYDAESIQSDYGIEEKKVVYIPNGVDTQKFNPHINGEAIRKEYGVNGPLLLCVTRLALGRFVDNLIPMVKAVAKEIPHIKTIVVGDGPLRHSLEKLRDEQGLNKNIIFVGAKGDDELPHFYNATDLYILPGAHSPPTKEFTVLEALACGKPVIYTNRIKVEIETEYIYDKNQALNTPIIAVNNNEDFSSCVVHLLQNEKKRKSLSSVARKTIEEHHSWESVAEKTIDVYRSLLR